MPKLRMGGAVPLLPLYAFMAWTGTTCKANVKVQLKYDPRHTHNFHGGLTEVTPPLGRK